MGFDKTLKINKLDEDGAGQIRVPTTLDADKVVGSTGVGGITGDFGGTEFTIAGDLNMKSTASISLGTNGNLNAFGGALTINGSNGNISLDQGDQLHAHGVAKIQLITIGYAAFSDPGNTKSIDFTVESTYDWVVNDAFVRKVTSFTGGAITATIIQVGNAADADGYIADGQINLTGATGLDGDAAADRGAYLNTHGVVHFEAGTTIVRVTLTTTGGNLNELTQGTAHLHLRYYTLPS